MWWVVPAIMAGEYIYHRWIEDHPPGPRPPTVVLPRIEEGSPIPLIYGTWRVRTPIMVWSGNAFSPGDSYRRYDALPPELDLFNDGVETCNHFSIDMLLIVGIPFYKAGSSGEQSRIQRIWLGDALAVRYVHPSFPLPDDKSFQLITAPEASFGGLSPVDDLFICGRYTAGNAVQVIPDYTATANIGGSVTAFFDLMVYSGFPGGNSSSAAFVQAREDLNTTPDFRNQIAVFLHVGMGSNPNVPAISFEVVSNEIQSDSNLGTPALASGDANPAAVILDLLTAPWSRCGIPIAKVDFVSFVVAGVTLFNEGHGFSTALESAIDAGTVIDGILRQIDGVLYVEPTTGKITLKLIRSDYNAALLDEVNPDNASPAGAGWYSVQGWAEMPNQVRVTFTDRAKDYAQGVVIAQNVGNAAAQGAPARSLSIQYPGCCTPDLANRLAAREHAVATTPLVKASVIGNRSFYLKRPGDPIAFSWPELGVNRMAMRIARIDFGQLHKGEIAMDLIRDVFDQQLGAYPQ